MTPDDDECPVGDGLAGERESPFACVAGLARSRHACRAVRGRGLRR
ncbi:hypothetical protein [Streptomyces sp. NPDC088674]